MANAELNSELDANKPIERLEKEEPQKNCKTDYVIRVFTSDLKGAGTKSNCFIQLIGTGGQTGEIELKSENGFHRNSLKEFLVDNERWIGPLRRVKIWHGGKGLTPEWHVSYVEVDDCVARRQYRFPCHEWVRHDTASTSKILRCMESRRGQMYAIQPATGVPKQLFPMQVSGPGDIRPENEANSTDIVNTQSPIMVYGKKKQGSQKSSRSSSVMNAPEPPTVAADPNGIENPNVRSHKPGNTKEMYPGGHGQIMGMGPPGASGMGQGHGMGGYGSSMAGRPPAQNMGGHAGGASQVPPGYDMQYQGMHGAGAGAYAQQGGHYGQQGGQAYGAQMMAGGGPPMPQPSYGSSMAGGYPGAGYGHKGGHQMAGYGQGGGMAGYGQGGGMAGYGQGGGGMVGYGQGGGGMAGYGQGGGYQMAGYGQGGGHQMAGYGRSMGGQYYGGQGYGSAGQYGGGYGWGQQAPQQYGAGYGW